MQMRLWAGWGRSQAAATCGILVVRSGDGRGRRGWSAALAAFFGTVVVAAMVMAPRASAATGRYAAMVVDANTGQVLHAEAADEPRYPASLTKMMTLYLIFEQLEARRLKPDTRITISPVAASTSPSKLGLPAGQSIAVSDAVKALITKSANDIAVALAEHIAGDETKFAALMTAKARQLGMSATTFRNAHGLPDAGQRTSARDMITLALRIHDHFPQQAQLFSLRSFTFAGRTYRNHNTMLDNFAGMEGMKTGYTTASGYNLVASVRRDGRHVLAAVFGGDTAAARNARMRVILTRSLPRASTEKTRKPNLVARVPTPRLVARPARVAAAPPPVPPSLPKVAETAAPVRAVEKPAEPQAARWRAKVRLAATGGDATAMASLVPAREVRPREDAPLGRAPSSLQAQASSLGMASSTTSHAALGRPEGAQTQPRPLPIAAGSVHLQVGAFPAEADARQKLDQARRHAPRLLGHAAVATPTVSVNGRNLFRARFIGLDPTSAASACSELRRQQIDCLVTRAE